METVGAVKIFSRSVTEKKLRYLTYIGDGDTKSFLEVQRSDPYPGYEVKKGECIGHVQKRVGSRLRGLKTKYQGKKLKDGKALFGRGRLTEKAINKLQNYYGVAIRQNIDNIYGMKKSVAAVVHHCSAAATSELQHQYCPINDESWCKYQKDKFTGQMEYKEKPLIPEAVVEVIKPIFSHTDLGSENLLQKCLHGQTQNVNESLNGIIWTRCPKRVYVGRNIVEIGVSSAVINFNDGNLGLLPVFEKLGIDCGHSTHVSLRETDKDRIYEMNRKSSDSGKKQRRKLRARRKGYIDQEEETEGVTYKSGAF